MPMETKVEAKKEVKEINAKADLLKVAKDIVEHLTEVLHDINAYVIPPQGQAMLADNARDALDRMIRLVNDLESMPDSEFMMVPESAKTAKGRIDAKGHQSGQHVRST